MRFPQHFHSEPSQSALPGQCSGLFCLLFWFLRFSSLQSPSFSSPSQVLTMLRAVQRLEPSFSLQRSWFFLFCFSIKTGKSKNKNHRTSNRRRTLLFKIIFNKIFLQNAGSGPLFFLQFTGTSLLLPTVTGGGERTSPAPKAQTDSTPSAENASEVLPGPPHNSGVSTVIYKNKINGRKMDKICCCWGGFFKKSWHIFPTESSPRIVSVFRKQVPSLLDAMSWALGTSTS